MFCIELKSDIWTRKTDNLKLLLLLESKNHKKYIAEWPHQEFTILLPLYHNNISYNLEM